MTHRHTRRRLAALAATLVAGLASTAVTAAQASAAGLLPIGGDFEQLPLGYASSGQCGALCTITATRATSGSNHYLQTTYSSLLGLAGSTAGSMALTSPEFTVPALPSGPATLTFDRQSALSSLLAVGDQPSFGVTLVDDTAHTTATLLSQTLSSSQPSFQTVTAPVDPSLLLPGHSYHLGVLENFGPLLGLATSATLGLDNLGLNVPGGATAAALNVGSPVVSQITSNSALVSAGVDTAGAPGTATLDYGVGSGYGSQLTQSLPALAGQRTVAIPLTGLTPDTAYHLRLGLTAGGGSLLGTDVSFVTRTAASASGPGLSGVGGSTGAQGSSPGAGVGSSGRSGGSGVHRHGVAACTAVFGGGGSAGRALLRVPAGVQLGPKQALRIGLPAGTPNVGQATWTLPGASGGVSSGALSIPAAALRRGHETLRAHLNGGTVSVALDVASCGLRVTRTIRGRSVRITVTSALGSRSMRLTGTRGLSAPLAIRLAGGGRTRASAVRRVRHSLRVAGRGVTLTTQRGGYQLRRIAPTVTSVTWSFVRVAHRHTTIIVRSMPQHGRAQTARVRV